MYVLHEHFVLRSSDRAAIPYEPKNVDYQGYLVWAKTNTAETYVPEVVKPVHVISRAQGKAALMLNELWQPVLDYADSLTGQDAVIANIALHDVNEWRSDSPFLLSAAERLGITDQLDALFEQAKDIQI